MIEVAPTIEPTLLNPDGIITALTTSEFGVLFISSVESTEDERDQQQHQIGHLAFAAGFSDEARQQVKANDGVPVFVDLREAPKTSREKYWRGLVNGSKHWDSEAQATEELFRAAIDNTEMTGQQIETLVSRGLHAAAELRLAKHFNKEPEEGDFIGFDTTIWPYRLLCVNLVQPFTLDFYYSRGPGKAGSQPLTWEGYDRLLPHQWDNDEALMFNASDIPEQFQATEAIK